MSDLRRLVMVTVVAVATAACVPRYIAPAPGVVRGTPGGETVVGEPRKVKLRDLVDRLGDCAPLWCAADSVPGQPRCKCRTTPPTVLETGTP